MTVQEEIEKLKSRLGLGENDAEIFYLIGRLYWKTGRRSEAMSMYAEGAAIDPSGSAAIALEQSRRIMEFYNKDLYNP